MGYIVSDLINLLSILNRLYHIIYPCKNYNRIAIFFIFIYNLYMNIWITIGIKKLHYMLVSRCDQFLFKDYSLIAMPRPDKGMRVRCIKKISGITYRVYAHRLIMNPSRGESVDHINHNQLDNTRENLRIVTARQNNLNKKVSGIHNVFIREDGSYQYKVYDNNKEYMNYGYVTIKSCFIAMLKKKKELIGDDFKYYNHYSPDLITENEELKTIPNVYPRKYKVKSEQMIDQYQARSFGTSKYKGVRKRGSKFLSEINHELKNIHLGTFACEIEAAKTFDKAAVKLKKTGYGLNFPSDHPRSDNSNPSLD